RIQQDPGFKKEATARFTFWEQENQTEAQDHEALDDYAWMVEVLQERFGAWQQARVRGEPNHSREYYNTVGRGKVRLTVGLLTNSRWRDKAKGEKPHLLLQLTFWTVKRSNDPSVISICSPSHLVGALRSRAQKNWTEPRWIGRDLLHDDRLHRHDWIQAFNGVLIGRAEWRSPFIERLADKIHKAYMDPAGKVPTFTYQRDGKVVTMTWRPESLDLGRYEGRRKNGVPTGPGRLTLHTGTVIVSRFENGLPSGLGYAAGKDGVMMLRYEAGVSSPKPEERRGLAFWKGESLDGVEHGPILVERGTVLEKSGNLTTLRIDKLGTYKGTFTGGMAQGEGLLIRPNGDMLKVECLQGIMKVQQTIKTVGPERLACYKATKKWVHWRRSFRKNEVLSGDWRSGTDCVVFLRSYPEGNELYTGGLRNGKPHGRGRFDWPGGYVDGSFANGEKHGKVRLVTWNSRTRKVNYDHTAIYEHGKIVSLPQGKKKASARRRPKDTPERRRFTECWTCNMRGYVHVTTWRTEGVTFSPFMPGSRHYGSWYWKGTKDTSNARRVKSTVMVPCTKCGGDGKR
ncbi:MAG: hypothetical protein ACYTG4_15890, partial [Planctomycetota bacterium]